MFSGRYRKYFPHEFVAKSSCKEEKIYIQQSPHDCYPPAKRMASRIFRDADRIELYSVYRPIGGGERKLDLIAVKENGKWRDA